MFIHSYYNTTVQKTQHLFFYISYIKRKTRPALIADRVRHYYFKPSITFSSPTAVFLLLVTPLKSL